MLHGPRCIRDLCREASGLIALLIAFTFDLDQPQRALLTVFIVAQPQSGLVLAKSRHHAIARTGWHWRSHFRGAGGTRFDVPLPCLSRSTASETRLIVETRNPRPTSYTAGRLTSSDSSALANPEGLHRTLRLWATKRDRADPCHSATQRKIRKTPP